MKTKLLKLALCAMATLPIGAWADVENKGTATWLFNQYGHGETVVSTSAGSNQVLDLDGLYFCIGHTTKARTLTAEMATLSNDMKDGENIIFPKGYYTGLYSDDGRPSVTGDISANATTFPGRMSLRINRPGKLYILCRNYADTRPMAVYKGTATTASATSEGNTNFQMLTVEITKSELQSSTSYDKKVICHVTGTYTDGTAKGCGFRVYGVKFVVSEDEEKMAKAITIPDCGYMTFSGPHTYFIASHTNTGTTPTVYYATAENGNSITLTKTDNNRIPACQGVIIKGAADDVLQLRSVSEQQTVSSNLLVANLAAYNLQRTSTIKTNSEVTNYNYILVADGASSAVFAHTSGSGDLSANKAFLRTTTDVSARGLELNFDEGETTGISEIEKLRNVGNEKFFDLQGRLVAQPTRGLYIVNGKKVIIK